MTERERAIKADLEHLDFLQDQLLCLKVISRQHNDFLYRSLVCGPQHTHVSYTPTSSHPRRLSTGPWISILFSQQPLTGDNPHINRPHCTLCFCHTALFGSLSDTKLCSPWNTDCCRHDKPFPSFLPWPIHLDAMRCSTKSSCERGHLRFIMTSALAPVQDWKAASDSGWKDTHSSKVAAVTRRPISLFLIMHRRTKKPVRRRRTRHVKAAYWAVAAVTQRPY